MHAVGVEHLGQVRDAPGTRVQPRVEHRVLADADIRLQAARAVLEQRAAVDLVPQVVVDGMHGDDASNHRDGIGVRRAQAHLAPRAAVHDDRVIGRNDVRLLRVGQRQQARKRAGLQRIVRIHEGEVAPPRHVNGDVARARHAAVFQVQHTRAPVALGEFVQQRIAAVGRTVVHEDKLGVCKLLALQALQAGLQVPARVITGNDDAQIIHACSSPLLDAHGMKYVATGTNRAVR